jgi:glycosyltransferase involved in cell wall biosynthesis
MKIAILGSRGIPNQYGGFEELAEHLSIALAKKGHELVVFNPHHHPFQAADYQGVRIIKRFDPTWLGSFGQFIYDLLCILSCRKDKPNIILQLGYTSNAIWYWLLPRQSKILTNMDGQEWLRSKYGYLTRRFLKLSEFLAARNSHLLIADHHEIQQYYEQHYNNQTVYIPYGAFIPKNFDWQILSDLNLNQFGYFLIICRMEPENHPEIILDGYLMSAVNHPMVVIGSLNTAHGKWLQRKFGGLPGVHFLGAVYDKALLNALRHYCRLYFHGHSVGGTNPSLLEAMACASPIAAHDNPFNRGVLKNHADYFNDATDVSRLMRSDSDEETIKQRKKQNLAVIRTAYNWRTVAAQYEIAMQTIGLR